MGLTPVTNGRNRKARHKRPTARNIGPSSLFCLFCSIFSPAHPSYQLWVAIIGCPQVFQRIYLHGFAHWRTPSYMQTFAKYRSLQYKVHLCRKVRRTMSAKTYPRRTDVRCVANPAGSPLLYPSGCLVSLVLRGSSVGWSGSWVYGIHSAEWMNC